MRYILVHVLDGEDFQHLSLNRDVWRDGTVVDFVKDNFVFIQVSVVVCILFGVDALKGRGVRSRRVEKERVLTP